MGGITYKLALPTDVKKHDAFHVSFLKKYVPHPSHVLDIDAMKVKEIGEFLTKSLEIVGNK